MRKAIFCLGWSSWSAIVYGQQGYTVEGDVWAKTQVSDLLDENRELYKLQESSPGYVLVSTLDSAKIFNVTAGTLR